jgi:dihydrodipicolinate synthase/N-acetylneuraminate lyase
MCSRVLVAAASALLSFAAASAEIRGPFPILSVPYEEDGALDVETLVREARFVADSGVEGFIWCQSNDAIDLLTAEEKKL